MWSIWHLKTVSQHSTSPRLLLYWIFIKIETDEASGEGKKKLISFLKLKGVAETSNKPRVEIQQICFSQGEMGHSQLCYILRGVIGQDWTERPSGDNASSQGPLTAAQTAGDRECDSGSSVSWKNLPPCQDFKELKAGYLRIKVPQLKKKKKKTEIHWLSHFFQLDYFILPTPTLSSLNFRSDEGWRWNNSSFVAFSLRRERGKQERKNFGIS